MAQGNVAKDVVITLYLNEKEAEFIKGLCQNYMGDGEESVESMGIRRDIFRILAVCLGR